MLVAAVLLACGATAWAMRQPVFALRHVIVEGSLAHTSRAHLETVIREELKGTFFTLNLDRRARLAAARALGQRRWPCGGNGRIGS